MAPFRLSAAGPHWCKRLAYDRAKSDIGHGRIAEIVAPALAGQLAGDHRRPGAIAILKDLKQVVAASIG